MWDAILDGIFAVIKFFYDLVGDWGMSIIIITVIFRILMTPLTNKQTKSSFQMQKVQPLMQEIQSKYKDDPQRMQEETQKLYAEAKFNPLAGCLPMLLQMPIFIALFQVLRTMDERVGETTYEFYRLVPSLVMSPSEAIGNGVVAFIPYIILMVIFAGATFVPMILQQRKNATQQKNQMMIMAAVMSVFMLFISWSAPAGVLLFWGTSSVIAILTQQILMHRLRKADKAESEIVEVKPVEVDVTRKVKKPRPTKKTK